MSACCGYGPAGAARNCKRLDGDCASATIAMQQERGMARIITLHVDEILKAGFNQG
jgi:hypothetical protein